MKGDIVSVNAPSEAYEGQEVHIYVTSRVTPATSGVKHTVWYELWEGDKLIDQTSRRVYYPTKEYTVVGDLVFKMPNRDVTLTVKLMGLEEFPGGYVPV